MKGSALYSSSRGLNYKLNLSFINLIAKSKIWNNRADYKHKAPLRKIDSKRTELWDNKMKEIKDLAGY